MIHLLFALLVLSHRTYTVQSGDTLYGIASQFLGNGYDWPELYAVNRNVVGADPNLIFPGQQLELTASVPASTVADTPVQPSSPEGGMLSCSGLERLWESAGGSPSSAFVAAEIAMAESGGNQYATGPAGERGYWQIHPDHGALLSTFNAWGNARAAVIISGDGTDWSPWTTFTSGAYAGRC